MKKLSKFILSIIIILGLSGNAQTNFLMKSWQQQVKPIDTKYVSLSFRENRNELGHSFYPWQQTSYQSEGQIWSSSNEFGKLDTLKTLQGDYTSKMLLKKDQMLFLEFGGKDLFKVTNQMFEDHNFKIARYLPTRILNYFTLKKIKIDNESNEQFAIYKTVINKTIVKLYIDKSNNLLTKITTLNDDELFGDVLTTYTYSNYIKIKNLSLALDIEIKKIDGKIFDQVHLSNATITDILPNLLERPTDYKLEDEVLPKLELKSEKYNDNIFFIELKHTDDRVLVVEFLDFLLVAEAPLNSENGELIIKEAQKIAPNKPIKYFVFGHYHPHYLGGVRPFVHKGAKIISSKQDQEYVSYIVKAKHTINPDSLEIQPKPLIFEEIKDSLTISDNRTEMKIFFIGKKSEHTNDYLIYYFPKEKLLFQDDLVWIPKEGEIKKARARQVGLYKAIIDLGIEVKEIIQSWPVSDYGVKTIIPFEDLEKSINIE
tara:strand:- start:24293 stop:25747 length:1455 start_codon:yes stop_codon:yes gene_type:complete